MKKTINIKTKQGIFSVTGDVIKFDTLPNDEFIVHKALDLQGKPVNKHWHVTHCESGLLFHGTSCTKADAEFFAEVRSINLTPEKLANAIREHITLTD